MFALVGPANWVASPFRVTEFSVVGVAWEAMAIATTLLLCIAVADRAAVNGTQRWRPYLAAAVLAAAVAELVLVATKWSLDIEGFRSDFGIGARISTIGDFFFLVFTGTLAAVAYARHRFATQGQKALHAVQVERANLARQAVESQLQAMQARVEPQFLFDALDTIDRLAESDAERADCILDALIAYLRAALPDLHESTSTLEREVTLAASYATIAGRRHATPPPVDLVLADEARAGRMPPMVLPTLAAALLPFAEASKGVLRVTIEATVAAARLRTTIRVDGGVRHDVDLTRIRAWLRDIYGPSASIAEHTAAPARLEVVLEVPYERTQRSHR